MIETIILVEFSLIIIITLATYLVKGWYVIKERKRNSTIEQINAYLSKLVTFKENFNWREFPGKYRNLEYLLASIHHLDSSVKDPAWPKIRQDLVQAVVLPLARDAANSNSWEMRFLAVQAMEHYSEPEDEKLLVKLVNDKIPLVSINAITPALKFGSEHSVNDVITQMAKERPITQSIYLKVLEGAPVNLKGVVENRLETSKDPYIRATCYRILTKFATSQVKQADVLSDMKSNNVELKIAAAKYFAHAEKENSISALTELLQSDLWQVRTVTLNILGSLKSTSVIETLSHYLKDSNWWVRLSAAQSLKGLGEPGKAVLKAQDAKEDKFAFDVANHVLDTL